MPQPKPKTAGIQIMLKWWKMCTWTALLALTCLVQTKPAWQRAAKGHAMLTCLVGRCTSNKSNNSLQPIDHTLVIRLHVCDSCMTRNIDVLSHVSWKPEL